MKNALRFLLVSILFLLMPGISNLSAQEVAKGKKEREAVVARDLGLNGEQSARLISHQENYSKEFSQVLQDTSLRGLQRSIRLKKLTQQHMAVLKTLLTPQQLEKLSSGLKARNGGQLSLQRQQLEARLPKDKGRARAIDSTKVNTKH